jgi:hypothetical protein
LLIPNRLSAVAKCHPVDAWDVEIGKTVARNRFNKMYKNIAKNAINKYIDKIQMHIKETQKVLNKLK